MKAILFIFLFLFIQEPVKQAPKKDTVKVDISLQYQIQNIKLDSIIATRNAEKRYNLKDSLK